MPNSEAEVVLSLKRSLLLRGLSGRPVRTVLVDADPSYVHSASARHLEPMATVWIGGARPDVVCETDSVTGRFVAAFEVKASWADWPGGLAQARRYRSGAHYSYLALPLPAGKPADEAAAMAAESRVGLLVERAHGWDPLVSPVEPVPHPSIVGQTVAALSGVPTARRLQLNHPLNYLVVPWLVSMHPATAPLEALRAFWPDLGSDGTRRHAIEGAVCLGLLNRDGLPTLEGQAVADLLDGLEFRAEQRPSKRTRLADIAPSLAAVARVVLLRQPAVQLIALVLDEQPGGLPLPWLARTAAQRDPMLGRALFYSDPSAEPAEYSQGSAYNPSAVFKLKQNLWHAGLLRTPIHTSAGRAAVEYRPDEDTWQLEARAEGVSSRFRPRSEPRS